MRIGFLQSKEVLDMMRKGIETEHFRARVSWPNGFDNPPTVNVTMNHAEFGRHIDSPAADVMEEVLTAEIRALCRGVNSLIFEIDSFATDRDCYRHDMQPFGCYKRTSEKKGQL